MFMYRTVVPHLTSYDLSCCVVRNPAKSVERKLLQRARAGGAVDALSTLRLRPVRCRGPVGPLCAVCFIYGVRVPLRSASPTMC